MVYDTRKLKTLGEKRLFERDQRRIVVGVARAFPGTEWESAEFE